MATLTARLTLTSTDWHSDTLSLSPTQTLTISGDEQAVGRFTTAAADGKIPVGAFDSTDKKAWIYLKNTSSTSAEKIMIKPENSGSAGPTFAILGAGEFLLIPYAGNDYIWTEAASGTPVLEYGIFEV